jgi:ParB family chromosome partitioning protein
MALQRSKIELINLEQLEPNPFQPRQTFNQEKIEELAESIKQNGLLQKITVIPKVNKRLQPEGDGYYIISGERRFRAYKYLAENDEGMEYKAIEAVVIPVDELTPETYNQKLMVDSLLENIDREDLTIVEKAEAIENIQKETGKTYKEIAEILGKSEGTIKNIMSLSGQLSEEEKKEVKEKGLGTRKIRANYLNKEKENAKQEKDNTGTILSETTNKKDEVEIEVQTTSPHKLSKEEKLEELKRVVNKVASKLLQTDDEGEIFEFLGGFFEYYIHEYSSQHLPDDE